MHVNIIDGNSLVWTMFHASEEDSWAGYMSTSAIKATINWLRNSLYRNNEAAHVVVWDGRAQWRYDLYPGYKSNRQDTDVKRQERASFNEQLPWIKRILRSLPVMQVEHPNAEADDVAWGLSHALIKAGHFVEVRTDDSDWQQMICARLVWMSLRKGAKRVGLEDFKLLPPLQAICEVKAIAGDASDTLDGIDKVADKRAMQLLQRYGSLDRLLTAASDPFAFKDEPKWAQPLALPELQQVVRRNQQMVTLSKAPALSHTDCLISGCAFDAPELVSIFEDLEMYFWLDDFELLFGRYREPMPQGDRQALMRCIKNWSSAWADTGAAG